MAIKTNDPGLACYLREIGKMEPISTTEEKVLVERIQQGDLEARNKLVCANLRYVVSVAMRYQNLGLPLSDLINEGNIGLIIAAERFDASKGFKFVSYAVWWIKKEIIQSLGEQARTIWLSRSRIELLNKICRIRDKLWKEQEREPDFADIAEEINLSVEEIICILMAGQNAQSLDAPIEGDDEDSRTALDYMVDMHVPAPDARLIHQSEAEVVARVLDILKKREANVIRLCFGLYGDHYLTLEQIGNIFGCCGERVRHIRDNAFCRLRHPKHIRELETILEAMDAFELWAIPKLNIALIKMDENDKEALKRRGAIMEIKEVKTPDMDPAKGEHEILTVDEASEYILSLKTIHQLGITSYEQLVALVRVNDGDVGKALKSRSPGERVSGRAIKTIRDYLKSRGVLVVETKEGVSSENPAQLQPDNSVPTQVAPPSPSEEMRPTIPPVVPPDNGSFNRINSGSSNKIVISAIRKARLLGPIADLVDDFMSNSILAHALNAQSAIESLVYASAHDHIALTMEESLLLSAAEHIGAAVKLLVPQELETVMIEEVAHS